MFFTSCYFLFFGQGDVIPKNIDRDLTFHQALFVWFSSWRFFLINVLTISSARIQKKWTFTSWIHLKKFVTFTSIVRIALIWFILKSTNSLKTAPSPWGILDEILLTPNSLLHMTFSMITMLMLFEIMAFIVSNDDDETHDWAGFKEYMKSKMPGRAHSLANLP